MRRLWQNIGWLLGGRAVNAILSLVYLALAARALGLDGYGYFALIVALGQTVTGLANFQTWQFVVRWGANKDGPNGDGDPSEAVGFAIALDMVSFVLGTVLAVVLVWSAPYWLPIPRDLLWPTFIFCMIALFSIRTTPIGILRLRFRFAEATAAEAVQPIVRAAGAIMAWFFMPNVIGFLMAWAAAEVAVVIALWYTALRREKIDWSQISLTKIPRSESGVWRFVVATNLTGSLGIGAKQVMVLLVGAIGGEAAAGGFRVAAQLGQSLVQLAQAISKAIYPELVHAKDNAVEMARRMSRIALVGGAVAVFVTIMCGRWMLVLIAGEEFRSVYWTMVILAIAGSIELVGASLEALLVAARRAETAFFCRAVPMLLGFMLLPTAMGWQGNKGAALTVMGSSALAVLAFWVAILSLKQIKITLVSSEDEVDNPSNTKSETSTTKQS